ncbi:hypothetical protein OG401_23955 [Kitasatospora purpeofusca]|uniref:hypothetical protein n=1 Tax=Kitasatospora purpeofusca TaxID=67352 RepID=UPI002255E1F1|nr:hypothetical protein [Kitasatospora purpeofusca]MCX4687319.1 hypothetical protein [Kitasatospora purpeofusca]
MGKAKMTTKTVTSMSPHTGRITAVNGDDEAKGMLRLVTDANTLLTTAEARELGRWLLEWAGTERARDPFVSVAQRMSGDHIARANAPWRTA